MANSKELMTLAKKLGQAAVAIGPVVALAEPVADWAKDKIDERGELIEVPRLYSKGFPVSLSDGVATVTAAGLTVTTSKLPLSAAHAKYRDCADQQIVKSDPPQAASEKTITSISKTANIFFTISPFASSPEAHCLLIFRTSRQQPVSVQQLSQPVSLWQGLSAAVLLQTSAGSLK